MTERLSPPLGASSNQLDVSVLVVSYNTEHLLTPMWDALMSAQRGLELQVIAIDNASRDGSVTRLREGLRFAQPHVIANSTNVGFGRVNNQGVPLAWCAGAACRRSPRLASTLGRWALRSSEPDWVQLSRGRPLLARCSTTFSSRFNS